LKPRYAPYAPVLLAAAVLVPVLALLGFVSAGREVAALAESREWLREAFAAVHWPDESDVRFVDAWTWRIRVGSVVALLLVLAARAARNLAARRHDVV